MKTRYIFVTTLLFTSLQIAVNAQTPASPANTSDWKLSGSLRIRPEYWDWFGTNKATGTYLFTGTQLRLAATRNTLNGEALVELEGISLSNLPKGSTAAAPQGQLGLGASYRAANGSRNANIFVKQGYYKWKNPIGPDSSIKLGRVEFSDGEIRNQLNRYLRQHHPELLDQL